MVEIAIIERTHPSTGVPGLWVTYRGATRGIPAVVGRPTKTEIDVLNALIEDTAKAIEHQRLLVLRGHPVDGDMVTAFDPHLGLLRSINGGFVGAR